jgi:hypothetical protein
MCALGFAAQDCMRTASVLCKCHCVLLSVDRAAFFHALMPERARRALELRSSDEFAGATAAPQPSESEKARPPSASATVLPRDSETGDVDGDGGTAFYELSAYGVVRGAGRRQVVTDSATIHQLRIQLR